MPLSMACTENPNPTNRGWWILHTPPTRATHDRSRIPPTAVGGSFIPRLSPVPGNMRNPTNRSWWIVHTQPSPVPTSQEDSAVTERRMSLSSPAERHRILDPELKTPTNHGK